MYIPFVVTNLCSSSHMRRGGEVPGQIDSETECIEDDGLHAVTYVTRQYHYQHITKIHVCMMEQNG